MYAYAGKETDDEQSNLEEDGYEGDNSGEEDTFVTSYTGNTSRVPIFDADEATKREKWPDFVAGAFPLSMEAVLKPGDMLFMPPGWWHAMQGEDDRVVWSVSMWF